MPCATVTPSIYKAFQFYSLQDSSTSGRSATLESYKTFGQAKLQWNMCTSVDVPEGCDIKGQTTPYGVLTYTDNGKKVCQALYKFEEGNTFDFTVKYKDNKDTDIVGIQMVTKGKNSFTTTWDITCGDKTPFVYSSDENGNLKISFSDKSACGEDLQKFVIFFQENKIFSILFILVGLPLVFCGLKFFKRSLATLGFLSGAIIVSWITTLTTNFMAFDTKGWIIFGAVALVVAIICAIICYNSPTLSVIAGGAALGYFGAQQLFVLYASVKKDQLPDVWMGVVYAICVGLGVLLGYKLRKFCTILATAMTGSYLFFFGIGSLAKNYPDLSLLEHQIKSKDYKNVDMFAWLYLGGTLLLFLIGSVYQHKKYSKKDEDADDTYAKDNGYEENLGGGYY
eukprot:TRINITY_DN22168_c0_g1_i1.p1 TRINITY_DN22168_c0_g1~~TRINITY_DN22168_c0_g1_i1.p1  ORF type:complete len:439 (-),score=66.79 TRINITY_DN22168_c0_g1_i1:39-1226(-)